MSEILKEVLDGIEINKDLSKGPFFIDDCDTLPKLFLKRYLELGKKVAHREKHLGIWKSFSWVDYYQECKVDSFGFVFPRFKERQYCFYYFGR